MSHLSCPSQWAPESCHQHPPRVCRLQVEDPKGHISKVLCSAWGLRCQGAKHHFTAAQPENSDFLVPLKCFPQSEGPSPPLWTPGWE